MNVTYQIQGKFLSQQFINIIKKKIKIIIQNL